jgi:molybdopterin-binding protein
MKFSAYDTSQGTKKKVKSPANVLDIVELAPKVKIASAITVGASFLKMRQRQSAYASIKASRVNGGHRLM